MAGKKFMKGFIRPPFNPTFVPDLTLWLDAAAKTSLVLTVSNEVSEWRDKSGQGNHFTQSTTANKPIYNESNIAVEYSTSDHKLDITSLLGIGGQNARTMFFVINPDILSTNDTIIYLNSTAIGDVYWFRSSMRALVTGQDVTFNPSLTTGSKLILYLSNDASEQAQDIDAEIDRVVSTNQSSSTTTINIDGTTTTLGNIFSAGRAFDGGFSEVIIYSRDITVTEKNKVYTYLENKYGI